jgi:hypothetical protein
MSSPFVVRVPRIGDAAAGAANAGRGNLLPGASQFATNHDADLDKTTAAPELPWGVKRLADDFTARTFERTRRANPDFWGLLGSKKSAEPSLFWRICNPGSLYQGGARSCILAGDDEWRRVLCSVAAEVVPRIEPTFRSTGVMYKIERPRSRLRDLNWPISCVMGKFRNGESMIGGVTGPAVLGAA